MKLHILSDLHIEFKDWQPPETDADVVVLAGDIANSDFGVQWAERSFPGRVVAYVPGNHEFYGMDFADVPESSGRARVLHRQALYVHESLQASDTGIRVLGTTLWTDFNLYGNGRAAMEFSATRMHDYKAIKVGYRYLYPEDTLAEHRRCREWLAAKLDEPFSGKTVVVTHHAPHIASVHMRFAGNPMNAAFASDLTEMVGKADLWIHGHMHDSFDYRIGNCRVVCNPRGYPTKDGGTENAAFNPGLVVEL